MDSTLNPLLDFSGLPRFDAVKPEHVTPAVDALLAENRVVVAQMEAPSSEVSWTSVVEPL